MTVEEVRGSLDLTDSGAIKNSIRNCLTVFQNDPYLQGAVRYNILTERIDIVKPLWWSKQTATLNDTDLNYLMLYLEDKYGLTSEKKIQKAISIVADCNKYHPIRDYLNSLEWDCALPGFVDSKNEEKTERNAGYLVVSHSGGGMLRQGTRKGIRRTPANRGMRAHWVVKGLDISEDVCHGLCP